MTARSFTDALVAEPLDVVSIEERADNATPGPWKVWMMDVLADPVGDSNLDTALPVASTSDPHRGLRTFNANFIAAARADVPALIAEVRELRAQRDSARDWAAALENRIEKALAEHERVGYGTAENYCDTCADTAAGERVWMLTWPCPTAAALTGGEDDAEK